VEACPGVRADHSDGAGAALTDGEAHTGDMVMVDTMIHSGADTETLTGDTEAVTGVVATTTDLFTEEVV
jgi:hypothetical protein